MYNYLLKKMQKIEMMFLTFVSVGDCFCLTKSQMMLPIEFQAEIFLVIRSLQKQTCLLAIISY